MCFKLFRKKKIASDWINKIKNEDINLSQVFNAMNERQEAENLYKDLCIRLHPDKFVGDRTKQDWANEKFRLLQECRFNLKKLKEINDSLTK